MKNRLIAVLLSFSLSSASASIVGDASADYLSRTDAPITAFPYTISFWYRTTQTTVTSSPFCLGNSGSTNPTILFARVIAGDVDVNCGTVGRMKLIVRNTGQAQFCANPVINDGAWHFIVASSNSSTDHRLWVDEQGVTSSTSATFPNTVNRTTVLACVRTSATLFDSGEVDDLRIYNRILTDHERQSLFYSRARLPITNGLVAYYPLNDGIDGLAAGGTTAALDRSGNDKHLTGTSGPVYRASSWINYK